MKFLRFLGISGGFLCGAIPCIIAFGILNPASYQVAGEFKAPPELTPSIACFYGIWHYPAATLSCGAIFGIITAFTTWLFFQKRLTTLAWCLSGAGYFFFFLTAILGVQFYNGLILPLSGGD